MTDTTVVEELLNDRTYHIEFNGHLSNHVKHAVIALDGLGATPEQIKAYYESYAELTTYGYGLEPPRVSKYEITEENWREHLGERSSFSAYCDFFDRREKELGTDELLRRYVPELLPGWVGAFTHATIHLGWAIDAGNRWMTVEGLAYMAFSYVSCHPERAEGKGEGSEGEQAVDSLLRIAGAWDDDREALRNWVRELVGDTAVGIAEGIHPELARSGLQYRIARLLGAGHPLIYRTPAWIDDQDVEESWEQLYYVVSLLYLAVPGDFVLLHLITSLHAMEQIAGKLPDDQRKHVVKCFWTGMLCVIFSGADFPERKKLAGLHAAFRDAVDADAPEIWEHDWRLTVLRAFEEDEEHNPKLVYVTRRVWERTGRRSVYRAAGTQFTVTPGLPPSFEQPPTE
ncbi:questin oxidase family protein [Streptomyces sp. UNOC14_S4]|uniref:questin oxidase family protein n=1 Tax=Streptomyces sp. UNOC14_S4 TaxID=2872340 RepID=UPI001E50B618|nr:questin oxidase family protein [Streptomyces sp. UNOC14_S4]MCC3768667.1 questin oxidase family protein [Streptomyces sp. UNOC14_S4]